MTDSGKRSLSGNLFVGSGIILYLVIYLITKETFSFLYAVPYLLFMVGIIKWFGPRPWTD